MLKIFFASANMMASESSDKSAVHQSKHAFTRVLHDHCLRYFGAGRADFENPGVLHFSMDGVWAGNDDNLIFIARIPRKNLAGIPPLAVSGFVVHMSVRPNAFSRDPRSFYTGYE